MRPCFDGATEVQRHNSSTPLRLPRFSASASRICGARRNRRRTTPPEGLFDVSTFGADVGAIMRLDLPMTETFMLLAVRSLYPTDAGPCTASVGKIAERSKVDERTVYRMIQHLESGGWLVRVSKPGRPSALRVVVNPGSTITPDLRSPLINDQITPDQRSDVSRVTHDQRSGDPWHTITPPLIVDQGSPKPPNKVFYPCSDPSLAEAFADAPAREVPAITPGLLEVERAFLAASGGGLQVKHAELVALQSLMATYGAARVIEACDEAVLANTRQRVSVRFVQAILERPRRSTNVASTPDGGSRTIYVMPEAPEPLRAPAETPEARAAALAALKEDL